jgi:carbamoyl-phosphate synthase small subunit
MTCKLALEDGTVFTGQAAGAAGTVVGEVVFNTAMVGYQEVLTDPSYCGQLVVMTCPMMGNYGVNDADWESRKPFLSGFIMRELVGRHSNWRATGDLRAYLSEHGIVAMTGIDTRALTCRLRVHGSLRGVLSTETLDDRALIAEAIASPVMVGLRLADRVTREAGIDWTEDLPAAVDATLSAGRPEDRNGLRVIAIDTGVKSNILRHLVTRGCHVHVVPCGASAETILACRPDGVMVCNGPGDPEPVTDTIAALQGLIGRVPLFGICLGHQLLSLALGARTCKLKFGHHGINHPVLNVATGRVEITSQNHGFAVEAETLPPVGATVTHHSLNDQSVEGFAHKSEPVFAVQYHPEAAPGPHDSAYLFDEFVSMLKTGRTPFV